MCNRDAQLYYKLSIACLTHIPLWDNKLPECFFFTSQQFVSLTDLSFHSPVFFWLWDYQKEILEKRSYPVIINYSSKKKCIELLLLFIVIWRKTISSIFFPLILFIFPKCFLLEMLNDHIFKGMDTIWTDSDSHVILIMNIIGLWVYASFNKIDVLFIPVHAKKKGFFFV